MSNTSEFAAQTNNGNGRDLLAELQARAMIDSDQDGGGERGAVDFLGPMMRRKSIIFLMCLIAAAIGYVLYRRESPTYQSSLRLMIWAQAAPTMMHGDSYAPTVSLPKQQLLISSELVLAKAVTEGKLAELESFRGNPFPVGQLKGMLGVKPVTSAADTLELTCRGGNPDDLPSILVAVKDAYVRVLEEATVTNSQEMQLLIEQLHNRLTLVKKEEEQEFHKLVNELQLSADDLSGTIINPYFDQLQRLRKEQADRKRELDYARDRLKSYQRIMEMPEAERADYLRVLAMDAEKYLQLGGSNGVASETSERGDTAKRYQQKIDAFADAIVQKQLVLKGMTRSNIGDSHPQYRRTQFEIESLEEQKQSIESALSELRLSVNADQAAESEKLKKDATRLTEVERTNIRLYSIKLNSEVMQHQSAVDTYQQEYDLLSAQEADNREKITRVNVLRASITKKESSVDDIVNRLQTFSVSSTFNPTKVRPIDTPAPGIKVAPNLISYLLFSSLVGGLIGTALALLVDRADMAFRNPYEIFQKMKVPVICKVPNISKTKVKHNLPCGPTLITAIDPRSAAAESFRACRTAIMFFSNHTGAKTFLVSSPSAGDGKSTTVSNLAVSLAQSGKRVCLLDCDLRRPRQHKHFGVDLKPGLIDVGTNSIDLDAAIKPTFQENLWILTSGGHPDNPGEYVVSPKFREELALLREKFDLVLLDSPPLLPVADATSLSTQVDGVLLVFRIRKGVVLASTKARELLDLVHARTLGVIVNGVDQNPYYSEYGGYGYTGYNGYGYGGDAYYERQVKEYAESSSSD